MADPRFFHNRGPIALHDLCARTGVACPESASQDGAIYDVATLEAAADGHLVFCAGKAAAKFLPVSGASYGVIEPAFAATAPAAMAVLTSAQPLAVFAVAAQMFYPDHGRLDWSDEPVSRNSRIGEGVMLGPGVKIGPNAEIGDGTRIGPNAVVGEGVMIGRNCDIGPNVTITHSYFGDEVMVLPGAQIGQAGFGFVSGASGHTKVPQLGRVIVQDRVEIGACTTIDRGALADTVIGEGTKIDNLVQIGHNCVIGRHCIIVGQVGMSGSCELGDFVVLGGQVGLADHAKIGDGARLAARSAMAPGELPGGQDYGGAPAIPMREWRRQMAAYAMLGRRRKRHDEG